MGVFDSVIVQCPQCGRDVEFQSKAGECYLARFALDDAPDAVRGDIIGQWRECQCGAIVTIRGQVVAWAVAS